VVLQTAKALAVLKSQTIACSRVQNLPTFSLILREQVKETCPATCLMLFQKRETNLLRAYFEMTMKHRYTTRLCLRMVRSSEQLYPLRYPY